jgi:hypothetical protein
MQSPDLRIRSSLVTLAGLRSWVFDVQCSMFGPGFGVRAKSEAAKSKSTCVAPRGPPGSRVVFSELRSWKFDVPCSMFGRNAIATRTPDL